MNNSKSPWSWVPSLYFAEGLPYVAVMTISIIMYKQLGLSNAEITFYQLAVSPVDAQATLESFC